MRLVILSKGFPPEIGGIGDHTDRLASELTRQGHTVTVVCASPGEARDTFTVTPVGSTWAKTDIPAILDAVRSARPDAIIWQYNPFAIGSRGLFLSAGRFATALSRVAPLLLSIHELWFPWGRSGARGVVWAVGQRLQARGILREATRWIVTTEERDRILSRRNASKVLRIPIGANIEPADATRSRAETRAALGIADDAFVVAHLGATGSGRDFAPILGGLSTLRAEGTDARLLLIGAAESIDTTPLDPTAVHKTGVIERAQIADALLASDVYVHADPVGPAAGRRGSLVAALAHGLPVIAYPGPDHASELEHGRNILLVKQDPVAVGQLLAELRDETDIREQIGRTARETYDKRFAWKCIGEAYSVVLQDI